MRANPLVIAVPVLFAAALGALAVWPPKHFNEAPRVNVEQRGDSSVEGQTKTHGPAAGLKDGTGKVEQQNSHDGGHDFDGIKPGEFLLFFATMGLWYATQCLVWDARQSSIKQIAVAQTSANAAIRAVEHSEKAFERTQRPYVYIFGVKCFERLMDGYFGVRYNIANYGNTPAEISIVASSISFSDTDRPGGVTVVDYLDDNGHPLLISPVLAPRAPRERIELRADDSLEFDGYGMEISPRLVAGKEAFVWIKIQYRGPFGDGYYTNACWRYDGRTNRLVKWGDDPEYNGRI